jgi:hypothetical protein
MSVEREILEEMQAEIAMLRKKVNDLSSAYNHHNRFLRDFRDAYAELFSMRWYQFFLWVRPFDLPLYETKWTSKMLEKPPRPWNTNKPIAVPELGDDEIA